MREDQAGGAALTSAPPRSLPAPLDPYAAGSDVLLHPEQDAGPGRELHSDPHDFAGLYIRHRSSFTLHARRYLRDPGDADEVVQEAFLRLFLALPELETELQALAYCRRTITNLCIDRYRAQARRPRLVDLESGGVEDLADDDPGDPVVRAEDAAVVRDALSKLSPLHRAALVKREIEEKPLPVIAEELDIAEDSVKHVLFRARRALRRLLAATSLAPGGAAEGARRPSGARAGSGSLAALLLVLVLGLGSGPNLEAIPVVGADLPDLIGVSELAEAVGQAVGEAVHDVADAVGSVGAAVRMPDRSTSREDVEQAPQAPEGSPAGSAATTQPGDAGAAAQPTPGHRPAPPAGTGSLDADLPAGAVPEAVSPPSAAPAGATSELQGPTEPGLEPGGTSGPDRSGSPVEQGPSTSSGTAGAGLEPLVPGTAAGPGAEDGVAEVVAPTPADVSDGSGVVERGPDRTTGSSGGTGRVADPRRAEGPGQGVGRSAGKVETSTVGAGQGQLADVGQGTGVGRGKGRAPLPAQVPNGSTATDQLSDATATTVGS